MGKMIVGIVLAVVCAYVIFFVRLGDLTFKEHIGRIANTPEVHDLRAGIADRVGAATDKVRTVIATRLHATRDGRIDRDAPPPDVRELEPDALDRRR